MEIKSHISRNNELRLSISFDQRGLKLEYSLIGVMIHLPDCPTAGDPGGPALPRCTIQVALPGRAKLKGIRTAVKDPVPLSPEVLPIAPMQLSRAGQQRQGKPYSRPEEDRDYKYEGGDPRQQEPPFAEPFPVPPYVAPDPKLYEEAARGPAAQVLATAESGLNQIVTLRLEPVKLTETGLLEFNRQIEVTLDFEPAGEDGGRPEKISSRAQAMRQVSLTRRTVVNPEVVVDISDYYPVFNLFADYLIITDNQRWDAATMAPLGPAGGDPVSSFQRLITWKRQRGVTARLVTISDIVANRYGNFRSGSRDLQEVIRRFLKMAHTDWGVTWVLLGGDTEIIPVRRAAGGREGHVNRQTAENPPPANTSYWTGNHLRMHVVNPGVWWARAITNNLVRPDTGLHIPYDPLGTSNSTTRGWYFTTSNTYTARSTTPTNFVRVNGPAGEINADLQFLYEWNTIPTDLYYSSLAGPFYNQPGRHDWDLVDNGVYGQHYGSTEHDGINYTPTVSLGRAPVRNATQADTFVNKVIAYEKFERPDGTRLEDNWPKRVVLVSENWGGRLWISSSATNPPGDNQYHHPAGGSRSTIKLKDTPDWNWSLLAYISESDVRLIPYRTDAATAGRGWYFTTSSTDLTPSTLTFPLFGTIITFPMPSQWIAVYGPTAELSPSGYLFNHIQLDGSAADQESLREQMQAEMPGFHEMKRLYEDIQDMTPAQVGAAPLELITTAGLINALNARPHIVSLSGHGSAGGCCKLGYGEADGATNGYHTFITYADSCLTNQFDGDAMSEHLINNANGGAVAYIGNSRFSWIGLGDDLQRRFFNEWATLAGNAHIGLLNDTRAEFLNSFYWADGRWALMSLHLMGDPEMPLWWRDPLKIRLPEFFVLPEKLRIIIDPPNPPDPLFELPYVKNWGQTFVHLQQGATERVVLAGYSGEADLPLEGFRTGMATLTVARVGHVPVQQQVRISVPGTKHPGRKLLGALLILAGIVLGELLRRKRRKG